MKINNTNTLLTKLNNQLNKPVKCSQSKYEVLCDFLNEMIFKSHKTNNLNISNILYYNF